MIVVLTHYIVCFSPARDLPQLSSSSGNSLEPGMVESETPPRASPPTAMDDTEVLPEEPLRAMERCGRPPRWRQRVMPRLPRTWGNRPPWRLETGAMSSLAPNQMSFRKPTRFRRQRSNPLCEKGRAYYTSDLCQCGGAGHFGESASKRHHCGRTSYPYGYGD